MPNWCHNQLTVSGPADEVKQFKETAVGHSPWLSAAEVGREKPDPLNFHSLFPVPEELMNAGYNEAAYHWERDNWGCKRGARDTQILDEWDGGVIYEFDTAWVPPLEFIEHISKDWPRLTFDLEYDECGIGFTGSAQAQAGKLSDHCKQH